ncbi:hypothetical protein [Streptomyces yerevanensis]|uniref:hypothetical protein n=1 Tax=Streptomyces yerevanensis TaxID=66378 RepID=UPI000526647A|nr:hypothetical protein [Streptomyces yerevanensis]
MTDYLEHVATVPFRIARPADLPTTIPDLAVVGGAAAARVSELLLAPAARAGLPALCDAVRRAGDELGPVPSTLVTDDPDESRPNRDNDAAFGIERHSGDPAQLLRLALLHALEEVLDLTAASGTGLDEETWRELVDGFDVLLHWLAHPDRVLPADAAARVPAAPAQRVSTPMEGLKRWVRGHHVFMPFSQGCGLALASMSDAAQRGDEDAAVVGARVAIRTMRAARAALCFAGDATATQYQDEIRPTLMPPVAPPQMSGLRWRDHEYLVERLTAAGPAWHWLAARGFEALLRDFLAALDGAYEAHKEVCAHFVGTASPSLLATARSHRPAVGVIEQFRQIRRSAVSAPGEQPAAKEKP